ncbi:2-oxoacid:ferredoxin oxidoreductase subunit beta [Candidatus Sumerlaeota bacterium]|nr:2-oxoacid:ferredoxin oxidoreductase subunit beta [Candidatus Sumerlaeota bacterium]
MAMTTAHLDLKPKDYRSEVPPDWCPGCGDFGVLNALQRACADLSIAPHEILVVSGIGCSSNLPGFFRSYGLHSLHGRSLPVATGARLGNHDLHVIAVGGDGDGYGIGMGHLFHSMRRNINLTYIVMDNEIYGLTTGQISPTSLTGMKTKTTPEGNLEPPANPLLVALAAGCHFVARGYSGDQKQLVEIIKQGLQHPGFALIDVFSPCVTFNRVNTYDFFKERVKRLEDMGHDSADHMAAIEQARIWGDVIPIGIFYQSPDPRPAIDDQDPALQGEPLVHRELGLSAEQRRQLIHEMM